MIDLTPLDVRKKKDDLRKVMRGYDPSEVDTFLQMVADRLEEVVRENLALKERNTFLESQVESSTGREKAVQEALVSAQALRQEVKEQASREAELIRREAELDLRNVLERAEDRLRSEREGLRELLRHRNRILVGLRNFLERELSTVRGEEGREPMDELPDSIREALEAVEVVGRGRTPDRGGTLSTPGGSTPEDYPSFDQMMELPPEAPGSQGTVPTSPPPDEPGGDDPTGSDPQEPHATRGA